VSILYVVYKLAVTVKIKKPCRVCEIVAK